MSDIEKVKNWLRDFPGADLLHSLQVDYTDSLPNGFGVFPSGLVEIRRVRDITGAVTVTNQYNFALYAVFEKAPGDDIGAQINADWIMDFQKWVQKQSVTGAAPTFGNVEQNRETMSAQNGALYQADAEGTAMYMIQLSATFKNFYEGGNK